MAVSNRRDLIDELMHEHDTIQPVLSCLEVAADLLGKGDPLPAGFQHWLIDFLRSYADRHHHAKEELALFPFLQTRAPGVFDEAIAVLLEEHERCRNSVSILAESDTTDAAGRDRFAKEARVYVENLRRHINLEHNELYANAQQLLTEEDVRSLQNSARSAEDTTGTAGMEERYSTSLKEWQSKFARLRSRP